MLMVINLSILLRFSSLLNDIHRLYVYISPFIDEATWAAYKKKAAKMNNGKEDFMYELR